MELKKLISIATMLITSYKQEVHLTYPSSLLSIGSRKTLETLRSLDVRKRAVSHLRVYTFKNLKFKNYQDDKVKKVFTNTCQLIMVNKSNFNKMIIIMILCVTFGPCLPG